MTAARRKLLRLIGEIGRESGGDASLSSLARRIGWSSSHVQRRFKRLAGETPKRFVQRVRLDRAAADLLATEHSILSIALDAGFESHEVFLRAFRRRFGCSPREFRDAARLEQGHAHRHSEIVRSVSPCVGLYRVLLDQNEGRMPMPTSAVEKRVIEREQPVLFIRRRLQFADLQRAMGECFGALYGHGQTAGLAIAGLPIARFVQAGTGLWTVDFVMPLAAPAEASADMQPGVLVSGPVAFAIHHGPYDSLPETNAAIEKWIEDNGYEAGGPPWESYVTDPGDTPDPASWRTEVFWPLKVPA